MSRRQGKLYCIALQTMVWAMNHPGKRVDLKMTASTPEAKANICKQFTRTLTLMNRDYVTKDNGTHLIFHLYNFSEIVILFN